MNMGINIKDTAGWGKDAQRQIREKMQKQADRENPELTELRKKLKDGFDSQAERDYYAREIWPMLQTGEIARCEMHKSFVLLDASEYNGETLGEIIYTPDFILWYPDGSVKIVEVKSKTVRKLQREYHIRKRLFIDRYCRQRGWVFEEYFVK